jgi:hypothetical protein
VVAKDLEGLEPVGPDHLQAGNRHVLEQAVEELRHRQAQRAPLRPLPAAAVAVAEADVGAREADQAVVLERPAAQVARQVNHEALPAGVGGARSARATGRAPGLPAARARPPRSAAGEVQTPLIECAPQPREQLVAEHVAQKRSPEEKVRPAGDPTAVRTAVLIRRVIFRRPVPSDGRHAPHTLTLLRSRKGSLEEGTCRRVVPRFVAGNY